MSESAFEMIQSGKVIEEHFHMSDIFGCDSFYYIDGKIPDVADIDRLEEIIQDADSDPRLTWVVKETSPTLNVYSLVIR